MEHHSVGILVRQRVGRMEHHLVGTLVDHSEELVGRMEQHHIRRGQAAVAPEEQVEPRLSEPEPEVPSPRGPTRAASAPIASTTMAPAPTVSVSIGPVVVATVSADSAPSGVTQIQLRKDRLLTEAKELEIEEALIDDLSYAELKELVTSMRP